MRTELTAQQIERYRERGFLRLDRFLVHGAGPNMTPGWRRAMTCAYMPDGATWNGQRNILADEQIARLRVGSPLDDDAQNPLVWSRTRAPASA